MKKIIIFILALALCLSSLFSCSIFGGGGGTGGGSGEGEAPGTGGEGTDGTGGGTGSQEPTDKIWSNGAELTLIFDSELRYVDENYFNANNVISWFTSLTSKVPTFAFTSTGNVAEGEHEIAIGQTGRDISEEAYKRLERLLEGESENKGWLVYSRDGDLAIAYDSELSMRLAVAYLKEELIDKYRELSLENGVVKSEMYNYRQKVTELRNAEREKGLAALVPDLGEETVNAIRKLYTLYTDEQYIWLANLYDPETGGFYYSNSGRDNLGYLPDLESTAQAVDALVTLGMFDSAGGSYTTGLPLEMREKLLDFARNMQSSEDGYFYHPQWGKDIKDARRGRDTNWALSLIRELGSIPKYDIYDRKGEFGPPTGVQPAAHMTGRLGTSSVSAASKLLQNVAETSKANLPAYLQSIDAWKKYIDELDIPNNSYESGNTLAAINKQITMAGQEYVDYLINYLNEHQYEHNGLWEPQTDTASVNGLMKLGSCYNYFHVPIPNPEKALESALAVALAPGDQHVCSVYNPFVAMQLVISHTKSVDEEKGEALRAQVLEKSAELVNMTFDKLLRYTVDGGGFHYHSVLMTNTSQEAPVGCATEFESDVNATSICSSGILNNMYSIFGVDMVKLYYREDYNQFISVLKDLGAIEKLEPEPVQTETFDQYEKDYGDERNGVTHIPGENAEVSISDTTLDENNLYYKYFKTSVKADPKPAKKGDLAYKMENIVYVNSDGSREYADSMMSTKFHITNGYIVGDTYIFDTDMMVESSDDNVFGQIFFMGTATTFGLNLSVEQKDGKKTVKLWDNWEGIDGEKNFNLCDGIPVGEWFNLRLELYKIYTENEGQAMRELEVVTKIFVNGEFIGISDSARVLNSDPSKNTDSAITMVSVALYRSCNSAVWLDNVRAEKSKDPYVFEYVKVDPEDIPSSVPTPTGTPAMGDYYNSKDSLGKRYDFEKVVMAPILSSKLGAKTYINEVLTDADLGTVNKNIYFWRTNNENVNEAVSHTFSAPVKLPENMVIVAELDMALGGLPKDAQSLYTVRLNGGGNTVAFDIGTDENGNIAFANTRDTALYTPMSQNSWYNVRFEAYRMSDTNMRIKVYINNEYALELYGPSMGVTKSNSVQLQMNSACPEGAWMLYDNLFAGYKSEEYVSPAGDFAETDAVYEKPVSLPEGTHGGGALYNDELADGHRLPFLSGADVSIILNSSGKPSTAMTQWIDGAVKYTRTDTLANDNVYYQTLDTTVTVNVAEFDLAIGGVNGKDNTAAYLRICTGTTDEKSYVLNVYLKNGELVFGDSTKHRAEDYEPLKQDTWYNLTMEVYTLSDGSAVAKLYVNGKYYTAVGVQGTKNSSSARVAYQLYAAFPSSYIMIDNVYMGYTNKAFVIPVEDAPDNLPTPEGEAAKGSFFGAGAYASKYDFNSDFLPPAISGSGVQGYVTQDADKKIFLFRNEIGTAAGISYGGSPIPENTQNSVYVGELDLALGALPKDTDSLFALRINDGSVGVSLYLGTDENGNIVFENIRDASKYEPLKQNTWYNLRFEVFKLSETKFRIKVYINNEYALELYAANRGLVNVSNVQLQFSEGTPVDSWIMLDNIAVGYKSEEYVSPEGDFSATDSVYEAEIKLPEGTHGGGALYNSSSEGYRVDFSKSSDLQIILNSSGGVSTATSEILDGAARYTRTDTKTNDNVTYRANLDLANVFEADMAFGNLEGKNAAYVMIYTGEKRHKINIGLNEGKLVFGDGVVIHTAEGYEAPVEDTWYNITFELYVVDNTSTVKIYINGVYAQTVKAQLDNSSNSARANIQLYGTYSSSFLMMDNLYMGNHGKTYSAEGGTETPDPGEGGTTPPDVTLPEGTHGGGALYGGSAAGYRVDFSKDSDLEIMLNSSGGASTATSEILDGAAKYTRNDTSTHDNVTYRANVSSVNVFEADMAFGDLEGVNAVYIMVSAPEGRHKINIGLKEGKITFGDGTVIHTADGYEAPVEDTWYNFTFEFYVVNGESYVKIYVNGMYAQTIKAQLSSVNSARVNIQLYKAYASSYIMLDNIYMGEHGKDYVPETTPDPTPGEGGGETPDPGEGGETPDPGEGGTETPDPTPGEGGGSETPEEKPETNPGETLSGGTTSDEGGWTKE